MTLWLVAVTPTFLPALHERADHLRAAVRLPRPRRALDRQDRGVEVVGDADRELDGGLAAGRGEVARPQRRRRRQQQAMGRGVLGRPVRVRPAPDRPPRARNDRSPPRGRRGLTYVCAKADGRVVVRLPAPLLHVDGQRVAVDRDHLAPLRCRPSASARARRGSPSPGPGSDSDRRRTPSAFRS